MMPTFKKHFKDTQAGVTLLLAILILSSVLAISFSLATILLIEVRSSGDLLRTEPTYYAAQGVTEQGIFNVKRGTSLSLPAMDIGNVHVDTPVQLTVASAVQTLRVSPNTFDSSGNRYLLYSSATSSDYARIDIQLLDTGNPSTLKVYLCRYNPATADNPCKLGSPNIPGQQVMTSYDLYISGSGSTSHWDSQGDPGVFPTSGQHVELILVNTDPSADMYVVMQTYGPLPGTPKGLPYFGEVALQVEAENSGQSRSLFTRIPVDTSTLGTTPPVTFLGEAQRYDSVADTGVSGSAWESSNFGTAGYNLITSAGDPGNYPSWASITPSGHSYTPWLTPDPADGTSRSLRPPAGGGGFINTWYQTTSFDVDVNITDGNQHKVTFFMIDWDSAFLGSPLRSQQIEVIDSASGIVLDTRTLSNFTDGVYMTWGVKGHVIFRFTHQTGYNAVISAIFLDP